MCRPKNDCRHFKPFSWIRQGLLIRQAIGRLSDFGPLSAAALQPLFGRRRRNVDEPLPFIYYFGESNRGNLSRIPAGRVFGRSAPRPSVQRNCGRQQARFIWFRTAPEDRCPRSRRPSLPARGSSRRLGGVAGSPEKFAAACGGRKPGPAVSDKAALSIFYCRNNDKKPPGFSIIHQEWNTV